MTGVQTCALPILELKIFFISREPVAVKNLESLQIVGMLLAEVLKPTTSNVGISEDILYVSNVPSSICFIIPPERYWIVYLFFPLLFGTTLIYPDSQFFSNFSGINLQTHLSPCCVIGQIAVVPGGASS